MFLLLFIARIKASAKRNISINLINKFCSLSDIKITWTNWTIHIKPFFIYWVIHNILFCSQYKYNLTQYTVIDTSLPAANFSCRQTCKGVCLYLRQQASSHCSNKCHSELVVGFWTLWSYLACSHCANKFTHCGKQEY